MDVCCCPRTSSLAVMMWVHSCTSCDHPVFVRNAWQGVSGWLACRMLMDHKHHYGCGVPCRGDCVRQLDSSHFFFHQAVFGSIWKEAVVLMDVLQQPFKRAFIPHLKNARTETHTPLSFSPTLVHTDFCHEMRCAGRHPRFLMR